MLTQAGAARQAAVIATPQVVSPVARDMAPRRALAWLGGVVLVGVLLRFWLLGRGVPTLDSDEGTIGLMALHMQHGEWSVFVWGQTYMGSLESLLIAPFLWIFGPSTLALRVAPMLLGVGFIISVYVLSAWLFSRRVALVAATLLALGPPFFLVLSVRAFGGYVETLLFGNLLLLLALRGATPAGRVPRMVALLGLLAGIALWTDFLIGPFLLGVLLIFWWQRRVDLLRRNGLLLGAALLVGVSPVIIYEIATGGGTARAISSATLTGTGAAATTGAASTVATHAAHAAPLILVHNPLNELLISLPIMLGSGLGGTQSYGLTGAAYLRGAAQHPWIYAVNLLIVLGAVALVIAAAIPRARHWRRLWLSGQSEAAPTRAQLRHQYESAILLIVASFAIVFLFYRDVNFAAPRYLLPFFAATPLVVGQADRLRRRVMARVAATAWWRHLLMLRPALRGISPTLALTLVFAPVVAWNVAGALWITPQQTAASDHHAYWIAGNDGAIVRLLHAHHIHTFISNDYWEGMRLAFETDETAVPVLEIPSRNLLGLNRYQPYVTRGLADLRPAYMEFAGSDDARFRLQQLQRGAFPGYAAYEVGQYVILLPGD